MFDLFGKKKQEKDTPYIYEITVPPILRKSLGFKSTLSSFYLVSDEQMPQRETRYKEVILQNLTSNKDFRGVYCSAAIEQIADIRSDLKKYCDLTGLIGLVRINGNDEKINPVRQLPIRQHQR